MSEVRDNREASRFELEVEGHVAVAVYTRTPQGLVFTHTEVPSALEGRGIGSRLARGALEAARSDGLAVTPVCTFFAGFLKKHPEYHDLVAPSCREQLGLG